MKLLEEKTPIVAAASSTASPLPDLAHLATDGEPDLVTTVERATHIRALVDAAVFWYCLRDLPMADEHKLEALEKYDRCMMAALESGCSGDEISSALDLAAVRSGDRPR
jgi:hypothetical protein